MKIILEDKVYVQKMDLIYLMNYIDRKNIKIPQIVLDVSFRKIFVDNEENKYTFYGFLDSEVIEFFKNQTWCVDYDEINIFSNDEIRSMNQQLIDERKKLIKKYLENKDEKKVYSSYIDYLKRTCRELYYINVSMRDILFLRLGLLKFSMPKEVKNKYISKEIKKK